MYLKDILFEDFVNYKDACMTIFTGDCSFKCCIEAGQPVSMCQNSELAQVEHIYVDDDVIIKRYLDNPITHAIVFQGLEPMTRIDEIVEFITKLREQRCYDPIVVYTGFYPDEIEEDLYRLAPLGNIVFKFGRYIPGHEPHYDEVLGVNFASDNQWGEEIELI